jgi:DHA2 family multidrug resistance protein
MRHGGASAASAMKTAMAQLAKTMGQQAEMLSYVDVFRLMAWCALGALPLVFLLKRVQPGKAQMH